MFTYYCIVLHYTLSQLYTHPDKIIFSLTHAPGASVKGIVTMS